MGVCIESFIAASRIGLIGFGDGRSFTADDPEATSRTSLRLRIDPTTGRILSDSQAAGVTRVGLTKSLSLKQRGTTRVFSDSFMAGDETNFFFLIKGENGFEDVVPLGSIEIYVHFAVSNNGAVTLGPSSSTKAYPSIEGYAYWLVDGELVIQELFLQPEESSGDLKRRPNRPLADRCRDTSYLPECG